MSQYAESRPRGSRETRSAGPREKGPAGPARDIPEISPARRQVLAVVADAGTDGATVTDIARQLGGHVNRSRTHLQELEKAGLVNVDTVHGGGRGRPSRRYVITSSGRLAVVAKGGVDYQPLVRACAQHLAIAGDPSDAIEIGKKWADLIADADACGDEEFVSRLAQLMEVHGFTPDMPVEESEGLSIALRTCPMIWEARENPAVVCGIHQGLVDGVLARWARPERAQIRPFAQIGACMLSLGPEGDVFETQ